MFSRKRCFSGEARADDGSSKTLKMNEPKRRKAAVLNDGWGPVFKNRETFVEMHLC